jgi:hypothetical protein
MQLFCRPQSSRPARLPTTRGIHAHNALYGFYLPIGGTPSVGQRTQTANGIHSRSQSFGETIRGDQSPGTPTTHGWALPALPPPRCSCVKKYRPAEIETRRHGWTPIPVFNQWGFQTGNPASRPSGASESYTTPVPCIFRCRMATEKKNARSTAEANVFENPAR